MVSITRIILTICLKTVYTQNNCLLVLTNFDRKKVIKPFTITIPYYELIYKILNRLNFLSQQVIFNKTKDIFRNKLDNC